MNPGTLVSAVTGVQFTKFVDVSMVPVALVAVGSLGNETLLETSCGLVVKEEPVAPKKYSTPFETPSLSKSKLAAWPPALVVDHDE